MSKTVFDTFLQSCPDYFGAMLCDEERNSKFQEAIHAAVQQFIREHRRPPRVLDVGAGTGLLSVFAILAGAELVLGLEANADRAAIARENIKAQGISQHCRIVTKLSTDYRLHANQEPFDMLICELIGTIAHYEQMNFFINDLFQRGVVRTFPVQENGEKKRFLVPERIKMWSRPFQRNTDNTLRSNHAGLDKLDRLIFIVAGSKQFQHHASLSLIPHNDFFEPINVETDNCLMLIDQRTDELIVKKENIELQEIKSNANVYHFLEWECALFNDIVLKNTIDSVSKLSASCYAARILSWGFAVLVSSPRSKSNFVSVTEDDVKVVKRRRMK